MILRTILCIIALYSIVVIFAILIDKSVTGPEYWCPDCCKEHKNKEKFKLLHELVPKKEPYVCSNCRKMFYRDLKKYL